MFYDGKLFRDVNCRGDKRHGTYHHPGCDVERCPLRCGHQLITCNCEVPCRIVPIYRNNEVKK